MDDSSKNDIFAKNARVDFCEYGDHDFNRVPLKCDVVAILPSGKLVVEIPGPGNHIPNQLCLRVSLDCPTESTPRICRSSQEFENRYQELMGQGVAERFTEHCPDPHTAHIAKT